MKKNACISAPVAATVARAHGHVTRHRQEPSLHMSSADERQGVTHARPPDDEVAPWEGDASTPSPSGDRRRPHPVGADEGCPPAACLTGRGGNCSRNRVGSACGRRCRPVPSSGNDTRAVQSGAGLLLGDHWRQLCEPESHVRRAGGAAGRQRVATWILEGAPPGGRFHTRDRPASDRSGGVGIARELRSRLRGLPCHRAAMAWDSDR